jgi:hypothetical protein
MNQSILCCVVLGLALLQSSADEKARAPGDAESEAKRRMEEFTSDYRLKHMGLALPDSAEALLLKQLHAKKIVDLREMRFERRNYCDYLAVTVSLLIDGSFESVYHHSFVFRKGLQDEDWSKAKLYRGDPRNLTTMSDKEFQNSLHEVSPK